MQKSLEEQDLDSTSSIYLPNGAQDSETPGHSDNNRQGLKIKESLNREFSIKNLKKAADNTVKKQQMRTPSGRNLSMDQTAMKVDLPSRTPVNKTAMMTPRESELRQ